MRVRRNISTRRSSEAWRKLKEAAEGAPFLIVVIACLVVLFFLAALEHGRNEENRRLCLEAGYVSYDQGYCIRTVDGSDEVVPREYLEGEALREFQAVRGASDE